MSQESLITLRVDLIYKIDPFHQIINHPWYKISGAVSNLSSNRSFLSMLHSSASSVGRDLKIFIP